MKKILIAYHEPDFAERICKALCVHYEVYLCHTGTDALAMIDTLQPDGLILFLSLPYMDGLSVLRKCGCRPPAILALTKYWDAELSVTAAGLGVGAMALIPCTLRHIVKLLEYLIHKAAPSSEM